MVTDKIKELEATKARLARLEQTVERELRQELSSLHLKYGFESLQAFVAALATANGGRKAGGARRGRPPGSKAKAAGSAKPAASRPASSGKRRRRAVITEETRATVKKMVEDGMTGQAIAKALKISHPSVQNIKKALGLVKARK